LPPAVHFVFQYAQWRDIFIEKSPFALREIAFFAPKWHFKKASNKARFEFSATRKGWWDSLGRLRHDGSHGFYVELLHFLQQLRHPESSREELPLPHVIPMLPHVIHYI
jgi:hypothetical protein